MTDNNEIAAFKYFIEEYFFGLNGGGTFTLEQLIIEFKRFEKQSTIDNLREDAKYLNGVLLKEDWEITKSILDYLLKKGSKNKMKRIINCLITRL